MSDLYRLDGHALMTGAQILEADGLIQAGVLVPVTDERLSRAEWEATNSCPGNDATCPGHDHGDPCNYRENVNE